MRAIMTVDGTGLGRQRARGWPICDEPGCPAPAQAVFVSPQWEAEGFRGPGEPAMFACTRHGSDCSWSWLYLRHCYPAEGISVRDFDSLAHIAQKLWGGPFLAWLLASYDLTLHGLYRCGAARREGNPRSREAREDREEGA